MTVSGENKRSIDRKRTEVVYAQKPLSYEKLQGNLLIPENGKKKDSIFLYFAVCTANLIMFAVGCSCVWISIVLPKLKVADSEINPLGEAISTVQEAWIVSLAALGAVIGPFLLGKFPDVYGRKKALLIVGVVMMISYVCLAFATNVYMYYVLRLILGLCIGAPYALLPMYIGEICEDHNRGKFGCMLGIFSSLGVLYTLSVGPYLSIKLYTLSCAVPLAIFLICFLLFVPESPIFLASKGDRKGAEKALMKFRNQSRQTAKNDYKEILSVLEEISKQSKGEVGDIIKVPSSRNAMIICCGLCFFINTAGVPAVMSYIQIILDKAESSISSNLAAMLVAVVQLLTVAAASAVVEKLGRKILLLISISSTSISTFIIGLYFYFKEMNFSYIDSFSWVPVTFLMIYLFVFNLGLSPVPYALLGEMFPPHVKSIAATVSSVLFNLSAFGSIYIFALIYGYLGMHFCFWIYSGFCVAALAFTFFFVIETKGKSLLEIQKMLSTIL